MTMVDPMSGEEMTDEFKINFCYIRFYMTPYRHNDNTLSVLQQRVVNDVI